MRKDGPGRADFCFFFARVWFYVFVCVLCVFVLVFERVGTVVVCLGVFLRSREMETNTYLKASDAFEFFFFFLGSGGLGCLPWPSFSLPRLTALAVFMEGKRVELDKKVFPPGAVSWREVDCVRSTASVLLCVCRLPRACFGLAIFRRLPPRVTTYHTSDRSSV